MIQTWRKHWHHYRRTLIDDLLAGATGAIAGAPQAMGFAIIAGVSPIYGLYTAVVSTIVGALTCSSTYMTVGPTNALVLVVGSTLMGFDEASHIERLFVLTLLVGVFQFLFGVLNLGHLTRFVSNAVMTGFITGAGVLIILGQLRNLTGYDIKSGAPLVRLWDWLSQLEQTDGHTVLIGLLTIAIIVVLQRTRLSSMGTLTGLAATGVLVYVAGWDSVRLVRDVAAIPNGLPEPVLPQLAYVPGLVTASLAMAVLASVQSVALTQNMPEPDGTTSDVKRDLIGQGMANITGAFFQGMPAAGSLSRTAVNINAGARSRLSNIFAGVFVALTLLVLGTLVEHIAMAALAGQLIVAASSLIRVGNIKLVWNVNPSARAAMVATFCSTLVFPLEYSIYIGVVLSLALYAYTSADNIHVVLMVPTSDHHFRTAPVPDTLPDYKPVVLSVSGHLFFGAVKHLEELMPSPTDTDHPVVILRMRDNQYLGSTGIRFLKRYADQLEARGGKLILAGLSDPVRNQMERTGALEQFGLDNIFTAGDTVFSATEQALEYAEDWLHIDGDDDDSGSDSHTGNDTSQPSDSTHNQDNQNGEARNKKSA